MSSRSITISDLEFQPLTADRWSDLETLFGARGANGGCWCMFWRVTRSEFGQLGHAGRHQAFEQIVKSGQITGVLAYVNGRPVGWCSIAPRESYAALEHSRNLKRIDDQPVWSIVCFFIDRSVRRGDVMTGLIAASVQYARSNGARIVEAYPVDTHGGKRDSGSLYMGVASTFRAVGFKPVKREPRLIMRYSVKEPLS